MMGKYSVIVKRSRVSIMALIIWDTELREYVWKYLCIWNAICILLQRKRDLQQNKNSTVESCFQNKQNATTIKKLLGKYKNTKFPKTVVSEMETEWISPILMIM